MRTNWQVPALSLALVLGACGKPQEPASALPDDLQRDLAAASAGSDLATATQSYKRARFVSAIEMSKAAQPARRPRSAPHAPRAMVTHQVASGRTTEVAPDPVATMESPETVSTPEAQAPAPAVVIAQQPTPEPMPMPAGGGGGDVGNQGHGGGLGGLLGGIIGAVVIRGGHGGVDKCDPRTEGRARIPVIIDRPDFGLPLPTGTFPGSRRR